jgi:hypothetical protein
MHRETHDILTRATLTEPVVVGINAQSLAVTDPDEIHELLLGSGLSLVAGGYAVQVLGILPLLNPSPAAEPRILLVSAYANMVIGNYMSAAGFLAKCMLSQIELSANDQHFLRTLRNACDYHTGRLDLTEFMANEREIAKGASPDVAVQHELETLRLEHLNTQDVKLRAVICEKLRATTAQIAASETHSRPFRLHARLAQLYADAVETDAKYIHGLVRLSMQAAMGLPIPKSQVEEDLRQISGLIEPLLREANLLIEEARDQQYPLLFAEALVTQAILVIGRTASSQFFLAKGKQKPAPMPATAIQSVRQQLEDAAKMFAQAGSLEGEIRAKLTLADWLEIAGDVSGAQEIARNVHGPAVAMGYAKQISRAEDHISGKTEYQRMIGFLTAERDMDAVLAKATDEELKSFAEDSLKALKLPADRLSVMERETWSMRDIAREQMHWCRYLGLMQDLRHTQSPETYYLRDPSRLCVCSKFDYKSRIESTDWKILIIAFKRAYCEGCLAREPKTAPQPRS